MSSPAPSAVAARFALIIDGLCRTVWSRPARGLTGPLITLLYNRLRRFGVRFAALAERFQAGRLPASRARRRGVTRDAAPASPPRTPLLPREFGWLVRLIPEAALYGSQLYNLLSDPEMAALLAATPRAGLLVRPVFRMLGWDAVPEPAAIPEAAAREAVSAPAPAAGRPRRRPARGGPDRRSAPPRAVRGRDRPGRFTVGISFKPL